MVRSLCSLLCIYQVDCREFLAKIFQIHQALYEFQVRLHRPGPEQQRLFRAVGRNFLQQMSYQ